MTILNHKFELAARPFGMPKPTDWDYKEEPVRDPAEGELLVKILYISLDPAMRGWMNEGKSYVPPVGIGEVMRALALGRVIASKNSKFAVGDYVYGVLGVQEYALSNGAGPTKVAPGEFHRSSRSRRAKPTRSFDQVNKLQVMRFTRSLHEPASTFST